MKKKISFDKAARIVLSLLVCGLALSLAGVMFTVDGDPVRIMLTAVSLVCVIASVIFAVTYCRCPKCGKLVLVGMLNAKVCPSCHRSLNTGDKVRGKIKK